MPFKVIQGHRCWYQSKARMRPISDEYQLTSYLVPFRSYRKFGTFCVSEPPYVDLGQRTLFTLGSLESS